MAFCRLSKEKLQGGCAMNRERQVIVELKNVSKSFATQNGRLQVLTDVSFQVYAGEIVALVGPSGCGKTTILQIITGLLDSDNGGVIKDPDLRLGYVFQEPRLLPWKTVDQNISSMQANLLSPPEAAPVRQKLLERTGLQAYKDAYPLQLSGGLRQRVELVRALAVKPELILMDEPFQSVDLALKHRLQELLLDEYNREGFGVLLVTHSPEDAVMLADRVIVLSEKPTVICREIEIDIPRKERSIKNATIFSRLAEILQYVLK